MSREAKRNVGSHNICFATWHPKSGSTKPFFGIVRRVTPQRNLAFVKTATLYRLFVLFAARETHRRDTQNHATKTPDVKVAGEREYEMMMA